MEFQIVSTLISAQTQYRQQFQRTHSLNIETLLIPYNNLPESEYAALLTNFGVPQGFAQAIANWDVSVSKGDVFDDSRQLSKLIGRPTTPLSETVGEALKQIS